MAGAVLRLTAAGVLALGLGTLPGGTHPPDAKALPEREPFLKQVGARLRSDQAILQRYTYIRTTVERERDGDGRVTTTRRRVFEVWPLPGDPDGFEITLVRNNEPQSEDAIARQRAEYQQRLAHVRRERANESPSARQRRERRETEARRENEQILEDVRSVFDVALVRREAVNGVPSVLVSFRPRADAAPGTREGRLLMSVAGQAWFSEIEHELVRLDAAAIAPIRYGWGILARINPGARAVIDRQRRSDGTWVPARYELSGSGRVLLIKGVSRDATVTFTNLRPMSPR